MHPSRDALAGFALGAIGQDDADKIADHLDLCEACEESLREIEASDGFIRALREGRVTGKYENEPECQELADAAMSRILAAHDGSIDATLSRAESSEGTIPSSAEQSDVPTELGNYVILGVIGAGGMGQVFKAEHKRMHRVVALKILPGNTIQSPDAIQRFQQEVTAAARLSHPNIVTAFDADEADGVHFLVMEYVAGSDLSSVVKESGPLHPGKAVDYVVQVARGLEYAHAQGVIHRDIKPANLLLDQKGTVKILDMGLAHLDSPVEHGETDPILLDAATEQGNLTLTGCVMGTVDYMPPEQALDSKHADHRADIYSLGCTLFSLLTGGHLYSGETIGEKLMAHRNKPIPSLCEARAEIPEALDAVYNRMVAKAPEDRYQSMTEARQALESVVLIAPVSARKSSVSVDVSKDQRRNADRSAFQQKIFAVGSIVGVAVVLLVLLYLTGVIFETHSGMIVVEIDDPKGLIQVKVEGQDIVITESEMNGEPIKLRTGEHRLHVKRGGLEFDSENFTLNRGGKVMVAVKILQGQVQVVRDQTIPMGKRDIPGNAGEDYALSFDGKSSYVGIPSLQYDGAKPVTLEATVIARRVVFGTVIGDTHNAGISLNISETHSGKWELLVGKKGVVYGYTGSRSTNKARVRRVHLAGVFDGTSVRLYVNGKLQATTEHKEGFKASDQSMLIGASPFKDKAPHLHFDGMIDEVRISNIARYTEDFTPQERFAPDEHTTALYHFDEGSGHEVKDEMGKHHGRVVNAWWVPADHAAHREPSGVFDF